ncbi:uncharacterized protein LOC133294429 [Gastrolobium bilobum]|uniref:uncharacterized protein LOC133294429 n=1 Tax=Gastrolobium bilobum TaxID=150636 RepID=UPI002AB1A103|nr:uncharacterized protein LOC133294429 [Gastrolobium bilobum]
MFTPSNLKTLHPHQVSSAKSTPSSAISSMKIKNLIHTLIVSHMCRIIRALSKVKAFIIEILKENHSNIHFPYPSHKKHCSKSKRIILGSFRLHYNWCSSKSSHVLPVPSRVYEGLPSAGGEDCHDSQLAGYLQWLEEKVNDGGVNNEGAKNHEQDEIHEIDMLAEMFIANCHEKFRLEKQESDRNFQEMLARSM